jgi:hypothetical protein
MVLFKECSQTFFWVYFSANLTFLKLGFYAIKKLTEIYSSHACAVLRGRRIYRNPVN